MQGTFIGFNTAGITFEDRFLALLLKIKQPNGLCQQYYLQAPILPIFFSYFKTVCLRRISDYTNKGKPIKKSLSLIMNR
jgi:hypothetical protein